MAGTAASVKPKLVEQMNWAMCMILACVNTQPAENVDQLSRKSCFYSFILRVKRRLIISNNSSQEDINHQPRYEDY